MGSLSVPVMPRPQGWRLLEEAKAAGAVVHHADVGVAVLRPPRPLHYYSLFSHALGCDMVVSPRALSGG